MPRRSGVMYRYAFRLLADKIWDEASLNFLNNSLFHIMDPDSNLAIAQGISHPLSKSAR